MEETTQRINNLNAQLFDRMGALHYGDDLILFDRYAFRNHENRLIRFEFALLAFVDKGTADVTVEDCLYHLTATDQFILLPQQSVSLLHLSEDFHARFVLLSNDFVSYITTEDSFQFIQTVRNNPLIHTEEHVTHMFNSCYDLLRTALLQQSNPYQKQILYHVVKGYIYSAMYYVNPLQASCSREEELTYRFMELVDCHYREQHSLAYYADVMHLSSKYISKCVRQTTGVNGVQTIANRIMRQAKVMLLARQKSIAEIGYELGFADQSAFGKFFRAHEQVSPQRWRQEH